MTVKSSARVGYLNAILAQEGGNFNKSIFESSNARGIARGGGGMLMFRIDRRIMWKVGREERRPGIYPSRHFFSAMVLCKTSVSCVQSASTQRRSFWLCAIHLLIILLDIYHLPGLVYGCLSIL